MSGHWAEVGVTASLAYAALLFLLRRYPSDDLNVLSTVQVAAHGLEVLAGQLAARIAGLQDLERCR